MSRIFLSHSSADNAPAIALRNWLISEGWTDLFLDLDPERGIAAGERWERALNEAASRCEAVMFLVSKAWLHSRWCLKELNLALRLNKRLFGVLIEDIPVDEVPSDIAGTWQLVRLASGRDHQVFRATLPVSGDEVHVTFSKEGLAILRRGLQQAGLHPSFFNWPPEQDPNRSPYRGLRPLEADDAGILFGREAPIIKAIDQLRGLRDSAPPRLFVILGASGAGKSSFLRAGLLPRLGRDDQTFLPLPTIRPERAVLYGESGILAALVATFEAAKIATPRADLRAALQGGAKRLQPHLRVLIERAVTPGRGAKQRPPTLVLAIDQAEELFLAEGQDEARPFLTLLRDVVMTDSPSTIAVFTIRSDNYERLQETKEFVNIQKVPFDLGPMPRGSYAEVIKGPARRLAGTTRAINIDDGLVDALLADVEAGGAKDTLPLLAFTLERLYSEYHAIGQLKLAHYENLGRVKGSIEAAVERALNAADTDSRIPRDRQARLALLRQGLIPWLAGIDPDTGAPRRRVAQLSEIPADTRPLIDHLVDQRLLSTDMVKASGERTIEPAHEALLRQWGLLQDWLAEDAGLLRIVDGIKRASRDWVASGKAASWLTHSTERLRMAERLVNRPDLAASLGAIDRDYLAACQTVEHAILLRARRTRLVVASLVIGIVAVTGFAYQSYLAIQMRRLSDIYMPSVLAREVEAALNPLDTFQECASCPEMVAIPPGTFSLGPIDQDDPVLDDDEEKVLVRPITIQTSFAVSKFEITFDQWDGCVAHGGCTSRPSDNGWGRGRHPVINVSWNEAKQYVVWLSAQTGKEYRLLTEAEWEFAARAATTTRWSFGDDETMLNDFVWYMGNSDLRTHPVGEKKPNAFRLYDIHGGVTEWVEDCFNRSFKEIPADGGANKSGDCRQRVLRGGSFMYGANITHSAYRDRASVDRSLPNVGFRVARTLALNTPADALEQR